MVIKEIMFASLRREVVRSTGGFKIFSIIPKPPLIPLLRGQQTKQPHPILSFKERVFFIFLLPLGEGGRRPDEGVFFFYR
jgi:hypothetical protein